MKENQNIERFFQEKFKDFEAAPSPKVWEAIEDKLKKRKRRIIPFWWFSSGIAASLLLGFLLYPFGVKEVNNNTNESIPSIVESQIQEKKDQEREIKESRILFDKDQKEDIKIVNEQPKQEIKKFKEKHSEKNVLTANHVVKISKKRELERDNNITSKVFEGALQVKNTVVKEKKKTGKSEGDLPVKKNEKEVLFQNEELKTKKNFIAEVFKKDSISVNKNLDKKWTVAPVFGLVKSNSFSKKSPLDSRLISSPTNGNNSFAYGITVAYHLGSRWEIQSGVQLQKIEFTNKNVPITNSTTSGNTLSTVDYDEISNFNFGTGSSVIGIFSSGLAVVNEEATLTQNLGYIEVPVELKYSFIKNQKFSSKIVTGFSTLFLNQNLVSVKSESITETFGSVNNLNSIDFSGNLGLEFDYEISKQLKFNVNPMFKVQLNTFSSNSNGFRPYTLGIYSGIKYQF